KMSINDPNRLNANYNNNIHRQPGQPGGAPNANQLNNFVQGNNQVNPQLQRSPIPANNSPQKIGQNPIPANNPLQNIGQNLITANNPPQNIGQNPIPLNIPRNIHQNPMPANNSPQNIGQNPMPANNSPQAIGQNPMPLNIPRNIPTQSAPVPHAMNQQFIPGINQQFLGQNMRTLPNHANNFRPGSGGNPQNTNRQGMNPQLQQNPLVQPFTQPIPNIPSPQNITPNIASNGAPNFIPNSGGQVASGFQHHQFNNQTPNIASNLSVQMQQPLNSNYSGPQDASPLSSGEKTQFQNSN
ncbi:8686_t:CDS:1, partial [Scutellospora calospora]